MSESDYCLWCNFVLNAIAGHNPDAYFREHRESIVRAARRIREKLMVPHASSVFRGLLVPPELALLPQRILGCNLPSLQENLKFLSSSLKTSRYRKQKGRYTMSFSIGKKVLLNGKEYTIVGTKARSFILERDGKNYKATADKMTKIQNQTFFCSTRSAIDERIARAAMWKETLARPTNEAECARWFDNLRGELSPENLSCDGECSRAQVAARRSAILACWRELEAIVGHKVQE